MSTSYGARAVGLDFNPSGDVDVNKIKQLYAEIIDLCDQRRGKISGEKARLFSVAITQAQCGQMWAVKAITWREVAE